MNEMPFEGKKACCGNCEFWDINNKAVWNTDTAKYCESLSAYPSPSGITIYMGGWILTYKNFYCKHHKFREGK